MAVTRSDFVGNRTFISLNTTGSIIPSECLNQESMGGWRYFSESTDVKLELSRKSPIRTVQDACISTADGSRPLIWCSGSQSIAVPVENGASGKNPAREKTIEVSWRFNETKQKTWGNRRGRWERHTGTFNI